MKESKQPKQINKSPSNKQTNIKQNKTKQPSHQQNNPKQTKKTPKPQQKATNKKPTKKHIKKISSVHNSIMKLLAWY